MDSNSKRFRFIKLVLFTSCLLLICIPAKSSRAATINAASASYEDVNAAVVPASAGDTVLVPAGSATWGSTLTITRGIVLQGAGIDQTVITGQVILIRWTPDATALANHETLTIKGFTFDGNNSTSEQLHWSGLIVVGCPNYEASRVNIIIMNNKFQNTTATAVYNIGIVYGVVAQNIFDRIAISIRSMGVYGTGPDGHGADGYPAWSTLAQEYGTERNIHFEDNLIKFSSAAGNSLPGWIETGMGGRIVVRYNTWDLANHPNPDEFWDAHGLQNGGTSYSTMVAEYYGNKIINDPGTTYRWICHRGGWLMMFNNLTNRAFSNGVIGMQQYFCDSTQVEGSFVQKIDNTYIWSNIANGANITAAVTMTPSPSGACDLPTENLNFFNYTSSFDGSTGVGCGPLAARPSSCTTGVGYWATTHSCSDMTGMVGVSPSTPISGTLYKCTNTNTWAPYYTPYTYPHPLRGGVPDTTPPAAPTGLAVK